MPAIHDISANNYIPELSKTSSIIDYELYKIDGDKKLRLVEYLNEISLPISNLINKKKKEEYNFKIQLSVGVNFIHDIPNLVYFIYVAMPKNLIKIVMLLKKQINSLSLF